MAHPELLFVCIGATFIIIYMTIFWKRQKTKLSKLDCSLYIGVLLFILVFFPFTLLSLANNLF